ncbi:MAG: hypothetical protein AUK47_04540 [Deltaproteobacteria bacterium CG2_30_63_29]|nr:MAG: hypothetical protein AUK47_04540 [Deltaproteobacteria bacterium CG2_30_63_29]
MHPKDFQIRPPKRPTGLEIRWLGTAGYEFRFEGHTLLIDPYVSRLGLVHFLTRAARPNRQAVERFIDKANAIVVGHSHFDHILDVPAIAERTNAAVYCSISGTNLMNAAGLDPARVNLCHGGEHFEVGPFKVQLVKSQHSRFGLGGQVPYPGDIPAGVCLPMKGQQYRVGQVFGILVEVAGHRFYHQGSADLIESELAGLQVDTFLMGISARHATPNYVPRILRVLKPKRVIPMHYDNFFKPMSKGLSMLPLMRFAKFVQETRATLPDAKVVTLPMNQRVQV